MGQLDCFIPDRPKKVHIIDNPDKVGRAVEKLLRFDLLGFDVETYHKYDRNIPAFNPCEGARMRLAQWATPLGDSYVFDLYKVGPEFMRWMFPNKFTVVIHNAKFEIKSLQYELGIYDIRDLFDTMLAEQILSQGRVTPGEGYVPVGLDVTVKRRLDVTLPKDEQASQWYKEDLSRSQIEYAARDAQVILSLYQKQALELVRQQQVRVAELEFNCVPAIAWMENTGFRMNPTAWTKVVDDLNQTKAELEKELWPLLGNQGTLFNEATINLDSKPQVMAAFQRLGLEIPIDKDGNLTIGNKELSKAIQGRRDVDLFVKYVTTAKRVQSFGYNWVDKINPYTGRIHCELKQMGAGTGRMACKAPNLMQIPKENTYRNCFEAEPGWVLVDVDYSQCELRILAEYCRDANLLKAFDANLDLHKFTGHLLYETPFDEVTDKQRGIAKNMNFLIVYGGGATKLATQANIELSIAEETLENYLKHAYPDMGHWLETQRRNILYGMTLYTMTGRAWKFYGDLKDREFKGSIQRRAQNGPIQGTNADITKHALGLTYKRIVREDLIEDTEIIMPVHDELVGSSKPEIAVYFQQLMSEEMVRAEQAYLRRVPSVVDASITVKWCKDVTPELAQEATDLIGEII